MTKIRKHIYVNDNVMKHVVLHHIVVKLERCESVLGELAMDYSSDENDLTGLTQNVFSRQTCSGELDDFSDILESEWWNLENPKQAELNASERCAGCDENPVVEGSRNIPVVTDAELKERKDLRIPANTRMSTSWATRVWKDWAAERNKKVKTAHSTEEAVSGDLLANTDEQLNKWLAKFVVEGSKNRRSWRVLPTEQFISNMLWNTEVYENLDALYRAN